MKSSTVITSQLDPGDSASLVDDQRVIREESSSKRRIEYIVRKSEYYSLKQLPYEEVQKQVKVKTGKSYEPNENTVAVSVWENLRVVRKGIGGEAFLTRPFISGRIQSWV